MIFVSRNCCHRFKDNNPLASQLLTVHNIAYMMRLMRSMRSAILSGNEIYVQYIHTFLSYQFPRGKVPTWVMNALHVAGIEIQVNWCFQPIISENGHINQIQNRKRQKLEIYES